MLKEIFEILLGKYTDDSNYIESLWSDIIKAHKQTSRYYHNLTHLEHLYQNLTLVKEKIKDWDMVLFALFYHDYVYNIYKKDNEEQSAKKAETVLDMLSINKDRIAFCIEMIQETKGHTISAKSDINYFTDADLSILGCDPVLYEIYTKSVRKEYRIYPDFLYFKGRVKVLKHFLKMPRIFKTNHFFEQFEIKARKNIQHEIELISK